jgi:ATP-binding cassette subfamily F protein uup
MEQRELDSLPERIETMEAEQMKLQSEVSRPDFYKENAENIRKVLSKIEELQRDLTNAYTRWDELDSRAR